MPERNLTIDGLRGYLALSVLCHHFFIGLVYFQTGVWGDPHVTLLKNLGSVPVTVFFMITAFLFYGKLVRSHGRLNWADLFLGRVLRLTPMYLVSVCAVMLIVAWNTGFQLQVPLSDLARSVFHWLIFTMRFNPDVNGFEGTFHIIAGVTWTLRYEWLFYFCLPFIAFGVGLAKSPAVRSIIICGLIVALQFTSFSLSPFHSRFAVPFLFGMLVYEVYSAGFLQARAQSTWGSVVAAVLLGYCLFIPLKDYQLTQACLLAMAFAFIAAGADLFSILRAKISIALGDASYSIYLLHGIFLTLLLMSVRGAGVDLASGWLLFLLPVLIVSVSLLSILTYRWIEKPFIGLGKRPRKVEAASRPLTLPEELPAQSFSG